MLMLNVLTADVEDVFLIVPCVTASGRELIVIGWSTREPSPRHMGDGEAPDFAYAERAHR